MMRKHLKYKHVNCTDMVIECLRCFRVPEKDYFKVKVRYWTLSADRNNLINPGDDQIEEITIQNSDMRNWKVWYPHELLVVQASISPQET